MGQGKYYAGWKEKESIWQLLKSIGKINIEKQEENYYQEKAEAYCEKYRSKESEARKQMLIKMGKKTEK